MTTNASDRVKCTVCQRPRHSLKARKSKLNPMMQMWLCGECIEAKREPKFLVILMARQRPLPEDQEKDCIRNHRYYGDKILAEEITV
jgi:hypothetical protein